MRVGVLVADESEARIYAIEQADGQLQLVGQLSDPAARMHDRDFKSDRPGRVFDHAPSATGRRGAVAHHSTGGERTPRQHEAQAFARRVSDEVQSANTHLPFDRLIVMAPPKFLGELRQALPDSIRALVKTEVHKDLMHQPIGVVREHLPSDAFK